MRHLEKLAVPVVVSLVMTLALPVAALTQPQQSQEMPDVPDRIDGKVVHKVEGNVVEYERPMVVVDVRLKDDEEQPEDTPNLDVYMMDNRTDLPDQLTAGTPVTIWYTTDEEEKHWGAEIQVHEQTETASRR